MLNYYEMSTELMRIILFAQSKKNGFCAREAVESRAARDNNVHRVINEAVFLKIIKIKIKNNKNEPAIFEFDSTAQNCTTAKYESSAESCSTSQIDSSVKNDVDVLNNINLKNNQSNNYIVSTQYISSLEKYGVATHVAIKLAREYPDNCERVLPKIDINIQLQLKSSEIKNIAGFVVNAIRNDYRTPISVPKIIEDHTKKADTAILSTQNIVEKIPEFGCLADKWLKIKQKYGNDANMLIARTRENSTKLTLFAPNAIIIEKFCELRNDSEIELKIGDGSGN